MLTQKLITRRKSLRRLLFLLTTFLLIVALSSMTLLYAVASTRIVPSNHCEGGDCCIMSNCSCPNCEGRGEPGGACNLCGGELCGNCGNCHNCGTNPCPVCRDYCFECDSTNLCSTCNGCLDCGHNRDSECPECGEKPIAFEYGPEQEIYDEPVPLLSSGSSGVLLFASLGLPSWSIFNLVLTFAGIVLAILFILRAVEQKKEENELVDKQTTLIKNSNSFNSEQLLKMVEEADRYNNRRRLSALTAMYVFSFGAALLLLLTQNFLGLITVFDFWSIAHSIMLVGILFSGKFVFTKYTISIKRGGVVNG